MIYILNIENVKKMIQKGPRELQGIGFIKEDYLFLFIANHFLLFVKKC